MTLISDLISARVAAVVGHNQTETLPARPGGNLGLGGRRIRTAPLSHCWPARVAANLRNLAPPETAGSFRFQHFNALLGFPSPGEHPLALTSRYDGNARNRPMKANIRP